MLRVQRIMCETCPYRKGSPLKPEALEERLHDGFGGFLGHRICHSSRTAACNGFWRRYKDKFPMGQIAQRLKAVIFVQDRIPTRISKQVKRLWEKS